MNEEIVEKIANKDVQQVAAEKKKNLITWLIFSIKDEKYALASADVLEIIRDVEVYQLPFLPAYIEGVINRRGDPFTVINPLIVLGKSDNECPENPLFVVLKRNDDQVCLHISDILFFHETDELDLHMIPSANDEESFYRGTIDYHHTTIPVLSSDAFELLLRKDLGST